MTRSIRWLTRSPRVKNARRTQVDGLWFQSKREANRYVELKLQNKIGHIHELEVQRCFPLMVGEILIGNYIADFVYYDNDGRLWVEDCKGWRTDLYKWKKKHFQAQYGVQILET